MSKSQRMYDRFPVGRRIEHIALMLSFITLAGTGLPQKFPNSPISVFIVQTLGGIENVRSIHHLTSALVMLVIIYHLLVIGYQVFVLRAPWSMMITLQDFKDGLQAFGYNLGFVKSPPRMGRYTFEEKFEYWAFVWGYAIMGITGFMMWNPITVTKFLPGEFIPAAKAAHGGEAVLAVLAILIWHMYGVNVRRLNRSIFTGQISEEEMKEDHPLELEEIKAGKYKAPDAATLKKRQRAFFPIAAVFTLVMLAGVYTYLNIEQTALKVIPPVSTTAGAPPVTTPP